MSVRALVTGATGMLGSYIVEGLLADGWSVRGLVRDPIGAGWLAELGAELSAGSLSDAPSLRQAARGCDFVFHAAAAIGSGNDWQRFRQGNVGGTANVLDAAAAHGARLVHVSSTSVFGAARYRDEPTDESVPLPELPSHDAYGRSKQEAERVVLHAHRAGRVWGTIVRPPVMYGRRDRQFLPRVGPVFERGVFPLIGGGRSTLTLVHAGSVARGAILAAQADLAGGRVYHLTDDHPVDGALLVRCAAEGLRRRVRAPALPVSVGWAAFAALALALRLAGRGDLARHAKGTLDMLTRDNPFTSARARAELGWAPTVRPEIALTEAFRWWKDHAVARPGRRM
jgi:nucleoside-diphosphate-sugar epimerase